MRNKAHLGRPDQNQAEIISALHDACYSVLDLSSYGSGVPDILCSGNMPCSSCGKPTKQNRFLEIKTQFGVLNKLQHDFQIWHKGPPIIVVRTVEQALKAVGLKV